MAGFKKQTETGIALILEQTRRVDLSLEVGQIEEEITVIGISPIVDLTSSWYADPDLKKRLRANADVTKFVGGHSIKAGIPWNRSSSLREDKYTGGFYRQIRPTSNYFRDRWRVTQGESFTDFFGVFLQDSWKVFDRLTVNFGVRLEGEWRFGTAKGATTTPVRLRAAGVSGAGP